MPDIDLPPKEEVLTVDAEQALKNCVDQIAGSWLVKAIVAKIASGASVKYSAANLLSNDAPSSSLLKALQADFTNRQIACGILRGMEEQITDRFKGQDELIRMSMISLVLNEHTLLEGLPGVGKTVFVKWISEVCGLPLSRVQFIPDMLPSDLIGKERINLVKLAQNHPEAVSWANGPIFGSIMLCDEINRAPAKVQAALLEAMGERQATPFGEISKPVLCPLHKAALRVWQRQPKDKGDAGLLGFADPLPFEDNALKEYAPFTVFATMNPIEQEGTYTLSEAQLDRFCFKVVVPYPRRKYYEELTDSVFKGEPFRGIEMNIPEEACIAFFEKYPKCLLPVLLPVYFFLNCRGCVSPLPLPQVGGGDSLYEQLQHVGAGESNGNILERIHDIVYMTNARVSRIGDTDGRANWYEREQIDMRTDLAMIADKTRSDRMRKVMGQEHCQYVRAGASPRAFLKMIPAALCHSLFRDNGEVNNEDIRAVAVNVLRHRIHMDVHARLAGVSSEQVVQNICQVMLEN